MRRTKGEIIAKILEVCLLGASKTRVVYGSNLNFTTVNPYLDSLTKNGFITAVDGNPKKYKTTDKGEELLAMIRETHNFFLVSGWMAGGQSGSAAIWKYTLWL